MERLSVEEANAQMGWGHQVRYRIASGFADKDDTVVDAACGVGYGAALFDVGTYIGLDKEDVGQLDMPGMDEFSQVDLNTYEVDFDFDIGVSFETIEHVDDYHSLISQLKKARKWMFMSVPVVPTVHMNQWHKHDFKPLELPNYVEDDDWDMYQYLAQPQELSEIYIFRRR